VRRRSEDDNTQAGATQSADAATGTVTVLAAASLTEAFEELGAELTERHPGLDIVYSFGPSSSLAQQAVAGAPADILVTADTATMNMAVEADTVSGTPVVIARNTLTLVTPADNPGDVQSLDDLARDDLRIAFCEPQVPCGSIAQRVLRDAGVTAVPDTLTTDVKDALALVTLGEIDAALVYRTDAIAAGNAVRTVEIDTSTEVFNEYPAVVLSQTPNPAAADAVMDAITGELGRSVLDAAGFIEP
jgi:molybdate transport system substrate-binding protein